MPGASLSATFDFTMARSLDQAAWSIALCAAGGGLLVWLALHIHNRQVTMRMRSLCEARMAERERVARELHDTLLQSMQGLILQIQAAVDRMAEGDPTRVALDEALNRGEAVLAQLRDRVLDTQGSALPFDFV